MWGVGYRVSCCPRAPTPAWAAFNSFLIFASNNPSERKEELWMTSQGNILSLTCDILAELCHYKPNAIQCAAAEFRRRVRAAAGERQAAANLLREAADDSLVDVSSSDSGAQTLYLCPSDAFAK